MATTRDKELNPKVALAIDKRTQREALYRCMKRGRDTRLGRLATLPGGVEFREEAKAIKQRCIAEQPELVARFTANAEARGAHVLFAKDGEEVAAQVLEIARQKNYQTVSKSKSLTTEEIELNEALQYAGLQVVETDLGELIIQLVGDKPFHLVFPSVHKMTADVAEIFSKATGTPVAADIQAIMPVVRKYLRPIFLNTDIGMTGANIGVAETGGIVIETNEGNARLVSSIGKCHICVMGIEKIVATVEDALMMVLAHPVSATGQLPTTYVTWMHGRNDIGDGGEPRESYIILLDNGRTRMRDDPKVREALHCIRCGACMNVCPTYGVVGGHVFGHIYPGPIGIPWTAEVHGQENAGKFADLCISCGLCKEICPVDIDMPMMIAEVKHKDREVHPPSRATRLLMGAEGASKLGCATAPISNWALRNEAFRWVLEKIGGIDRRREFPSFARRTFRQRWKAQRQPSPHPSPSGRGSNQEGRGSNTRVALFHDLYANYNAPELGLAAARAIEALGCEIVVPEQQGCGYPYIGYGQLDRAREVAAYNVARLAPLAREGYAIVTPEPTAAYCFKESYPKLLDYSEDARIVAAQSWEFFNFLNAHGAVADDALLAGRRFGFHCSCHQRPLDSGRAAMEWLRKRGAQVELIETGTCCGMAGTFGMKHGPLGYDLANAVGEPLFNLFKEASIDAIVTESSVCRIHLAEGTGIPVYHPLELLQLA